MRQLENVVAHHPSGFFDLAAAPRQPLDAMPTSSRKTRVRGFRRRASGQTSSRRRCRSIITPGSRGCAYKTVSGRHEWPNRDPIGERGGINLYRFVGNNPVNKIDPLGLYVSITTADGVTTTIPTTTGALINALQNDVNSGSQVTGIIIAGHGTPDLITLDAAQTQLLIASNGKILLVDGSNDDNTTSTDITDLLKKALAPKATIQLNACHTAKGDNNLTKDLSQILPNTPISGISTYAIGPAGGGLGTGTEGLGYGSVLGIRVTFVNGNKQ